MGLIIPAIDIYEGKVVRLTRGDFSQRTVYSEDPLDLVRFFRSKGFRRVHVVDLEGAETGKIKVLDLVTRVKERYSDVIIQFGGGVRSYETVERVISAGADFVVIGTMFVKNPEEFQAVVNTFRDRVILSLDINVDRVVIQGWQVDSYFSIEEAFRNALEIGVTKIISTDVARDGTLLGPNMTLISTLLNTLRTKYFDILINELFSIDSVRTIINESVEGLIRSIDEFMVSLKSPYTGGYEVRHKIEEYDENFNKYKKAIESVIPWEEILRKHPKPSLIFSGGISSDSDIEEIFKLDNPFLEGVIVGKSLYEGRLSIFKG